MAIGLPLYICNTIHLYGFNYWYGIEETWELKRALPPTIDMDPTKGCEPIRLSNAGFSSMTLLLKGGMTMLL